MAEYGSGGNPHKKRKKRRKPVDAFGNSLTGKMATADYTPASRYYWGTHIRELPLFSFPIIQWMLRDPTINLGLSMRAAPVAGADVGFYDGTDWQLGVKAEREDVKDFIERQMKHIFTYEVPAMLVDQIYGWSCGEIKYKTRVDNRGETILEIDRIVDIHPLDGKAIVHKDHGLVGLELSHNTKSEMDSPRRTPRLGVPGRSYWKTFTTHDDRYYGTSILYKSYTAFADKWFNGGANDVQRLYMHKYAYAGTRIYYPPGSMNIPGKGLTPNRDVARQIAEQSKSGNVVELPNIYDKNGRRLWEMQDGGQSNNPGHILEYPDKLDIQMLRGMEIPDDVLTSQGMSGAWAGKQVPMISFYNNLQVWANQLLRMIDEQIIRFLVEVNFGEVDYEMSIIPFWVQALMQESKGQSMLAKAMQPDPAAMGAGGGLAGMLGGQMPGAPGSAPGGFSADQSQQPMPQQSSPIGLSLVDRNPYDRLALMSEIRQNPRWMDSSRIRRMATTEINKNLDNEGRLISVGTGEMSPEEIVHRARNAVRLPSSDNHHGNGNGRPRAVA